MFYVADGKIYLSERDPETRKFPEVALRKDGEDLRLVRVGDGVAVKPKDRKVCIMSELVAMFGNKAQPMQTKAPMSPTPGKQG